MSVQSIHFQEEMWNVARIAPITLESGRYEGLEVDERLYPICKNEIEIEKHVIT